jgi:CheY-like chemotaxis protein
MCPVIPISGPAPEAAGPILVVDDEPYQLLFMEKGLQRLGYRTVGCGSAEDALERVRKERFSAILTDMFMPGMDGVQLTGEIRKIDSSASILLVTALKSVHHLTEALKAGADGFLLKPIELELMKLVLEREMRIRALVERASERAQ